MIEKCPEKGLQGMSWEGVGPLKPDIRTAQQQTGVTRTRHECLKARWRIKRCSQNRADNRE